MTTNGYFRGRSGTRFDYSDIADRIRKEAPHTLGKHISVQLQAIGLYDELMNGTTPCGLPYTFAEEPRLIEKQLTSNALFYTPGFFRALQHDYRIKGAPRRRAVKLLSDGYRLSRTEAEGLLSGAIAITIDEGAGTITYTGAPGRAFATADQPARFNIEHNPDQNGDRVHVRVDGKFDVAIIRTDEGIVVDVYPKEGMEPVASTYAFDADVEPESTAN